jgi:hypothetical protein
MTTRTPYAASNLTIIAPEAPEAGEFRKKFWSALRNATVAQTQVVTNKSRPQEVTLINITNVFPARFVKGRNSDYRRTPCPLCVRFLAGLSRQDHGVSAVEHGGGMEAVTRGVGCPQEPTRTPLSHGGEEETRGRAADAADFYSHTNYIELKKTVIDTRLGRSTFTRGRRSCPAPANEPARRGIGSTIPSA